MAAPRMIAWLPSDVDWLFRVERTRMRMVPMASALPYPSAEASNVLHRPSGASIPANTCAVLFLFPAVLAKSNLEKGIVL